MSSFREAMPKCQLYLERSPAEKKKAVYSTPNNDLKVFRTRAGIMMIYNDADGSALIEDASGTQFFMDGKGNVKLLAKKNIEIQAGEDIIIKAGNDIKLEANRDIIQSADRDVDISALGNINEIGNNKNEHITEKLTRSSIESTHHAEKVTVLSTRENMLLESSENSVEINSSENTSIF